MKTRNVFVKHYAPYYMLVDTKHQSWKGNKLWPKFDQVIYTLVPNCLQNCLSLTQVSPQILRLQDFHWPKFENGHYSTMKPLTEKKKKIKKEN